MISGFPILVVTVFPANIEMVLCSESAKILATSSSRSESSLERASTSESRSSPPSSKALISSGLSNSSGIKLF